MILKYSNNIPNYYKKYIIHILNFKQFQSNENSLRLYTYNQIQHYE